MPDNEVAPDGWRVLEGDGKVLNGWRGDMEVASGGKDVTIPTDDQAGQQEGTELDIYIREICKQEHLFSQN